MVRVKNANTNFFGCHTFSHTQNLKPALLHIVLMTITRTADVLELITTKHSFRKRLTLLWLNSPGWVFRVPTAQLDDQLRAQRMD